jgi:hypothetical protein
LNTLRLSHSLAKICLCSRGLSRYLAFLALKKL